MKRKWILLLFSVVFILCACQKEDDSLYIKSIFAEGETPVHHVVDIYAPEKSYDLTVEPTVQFRIGLGSGRHYNRASHSGESMYLEIEAEGCSIGGIKDYYEKEYKDYYEDDKYMADIEESFWGYDILTPQIYEYLDIEFPKEESRGRIKIRLANRVDDSVWHTARLEMYYATDGTKVYLSHSMIYEIDSELYAK